MKQLLIILFFLLECVVEIPAQNSPAPRKYVEFVLTPDHSDWNYRIGEKALVRVTVLKQGIPQENVKVVFETGSEMLSPTVKGEVITRNGAAIIVIGTSDTPGFRQCKVETTMDGNRYNDLIKVAFSPAQIRPTVTCPIDFNAFWDSQMASLKELPLQVKTAYLSDYSTEKVDVYLVSFQVDKENKRIYGYLCKPKAPGKYPVLLSPPGAGVKPQVPSTAYADNGFISLSIEIHGLSPLLPEAQYKELSAAFGDYMYSGMDNREHFYYRNVYLGCVRAIDFLCSQPEFDGKNVVVTGGSQGGALTIVTAALDKRVTLLAAFYPALCDLTGYLHGRAGGWPNLFSAKSKEKTATKERIETLSYYDVVNFARQIRVPGFYSWGYNDTTCPPTSVFAAVNQITAPKEMVITPISGHWRFPESHQASIDWIKSHLK
jgi:cephalosporin-C deacetylase